jgi:hypothetical protein
MKKYREKIQQSAAPMASRTTSLLLTAPTIALLKTRARRQAKTEHAVKVPTNTPAWIQAIRVDPSLKA